ncbi:MAG: DUF1295 domain-containing protein [Myxococcota bacterium]|nr:DUF1295 domain-containing protein [Myxococcota bacterium]
MFFSNNVVPSSVKARWLDRTEQVLLVVAYGWLLLRIWPEQVQVHNWFSLLLLASEGIVVIFVLIRRPTELISDRPWDWFIAVAGTFLALAVGPGGAPLVTAAVAAPLLVLGVAIHTGAKLSLRRSFGIVAAARGVMDKGLYRLVRHPMYAGYFLTHLGYLLLAPSIWNLVVYMTVWLFLGARILAEERMLLKDPEYSAYAERVRWRVVPLVY